MISLRQPTLLFCIAAMTACASSPNEDVDGPAGIGDSKGDEPGCDIEAYKAYLRGFYQAQSAERRHNNDGVTALASAAANNPCLASDAAYVVWTKFVNQLVLTPLAARIPRVPVDGIFANAADYQRYVDARTLTGDEQWLIQTWNLSKPTTVGKLAVNEWSKLYAPFVDIAKRPGLVATQILEPAFVITPDEKAALDAIASMRAESKAGLSYQIWYDLVFKTIVDDYTTNTDEAVVERIDELAAQVTATQPEAANDVDQVAFLDRFVARLTLEATTRFKALDAIQLTNPGGGGPLAIKSWLSALSSKVSGLSTPNASDRVFVDRLLEVKPCGEDLALQDASDRLGRALVALGLAEPANVTAMSECE